MHPHIHTHTGAHIQLQIEMEMEMYEFNEIVGWIGIVLVDFCRELQKS